MNKKRKLLRRLIVITILGIFIATASNITLKTELSEHCEFTDSHRSWTEYPQGLKRAVDHIPSALETHLVKHHPEQLKHNWTIHSKRDDAFYGLSRTHSCYSISEFANHENIFHTPFVKQPSGHNIMTFYQLLQPGDDARITSRINGLIDWRIFLRNQ